MNYSRSRRTASPVLSDAPAQYPDTLSDYPVLRTLAPETINSLQA